jgi:hypothetical protein
MEQRRLRLGDILDDYCPRERRVTNHAVVAMIDEDVKQTRCTTCDAEHPYKGGKEPRKRKKETPGALYREVLAGLDPEVSPILTAPPPDQSEPAVPPEAEFAAHDLPLEADSGAGDIDPDAPPAEPIPDVEEGPVHRPLIRATLPRIEGQKDVRQMPEFTVRHSGNRGNGKHRGETGFRSRGPGGNRPQGTGGSRFAGSRGGSNRGPGAGGGRPGAGGFRSSQQPRQGGRKRSR